jgi:serpin B
MMMVDVGAAGETDSQIRQALHLPNGAAAAAPAYATLTCGDETDGNATGDELKVANAVWAQRGKAFASLFLSVLADGYKAPLQQVDFASDAAAATSTINDWVSQATDGKIPMLFSTEITPSTRLVLTDAVYFKGSWATAFDASRTMPRPFTLGDGSVVQVPTMDGRVQLARGSVPASAAATSANSPPAIYELAYKGGELAMDFLVPASGQSLSDFEAALTADSLAQGLAGVGISLSTELYLPRFTFETQFELTSVLMQMGMTDAFERATADFSAMDGDRDLWVSAVVHHATIEVDEQGTVAAAATGASVSAASVANEPPVVLIDHPFMFVIRDVKSGSILFMGHVQDPRG